MEICITGIVLQTRSSGKNHTLSTLFTPQGLYTFFVKHGQTLQCDYREALVPISLGKYILNHTSSRMPTLIHGDIINSFEGIKQTYTRIDASGKMVQALLTSQWKEKPSHKLFSLFLNFLHRIPESSNPEFFAAIFVLKLLQYEGILDLTQACSICKVSLPSGCYRYQGHKLCTKHGHKHAIAISKEEEHILQAIVHAKQFCELLTIAEFPIAIGEKIFYLFNSLQEENIRETATLPKPTKIKF
ncbi:Recombination protein O,DNA repair protein RecO,DNA repair protein RecO,Recombination protein O N terminal [Chlamydia serpentis]|uniref:DNA repair protein RecO n=1 Tax=Chlamydia serpentis TaxID=1967782 RepID=A0A2R8FBA8_9CHLA|nr:Recombination protein O,DNA repair protein RecO,DNA repair protein RecO,Recombination protein O N terminal [Chlamydia serpentis]